MKITFSVRIFRRVGSSEAKSEFGSQKLEKCEGCVIFLRTRIFIVLKIKDAQKRLKIG